MVEIPQPPPLELTEHEREVIQRNREYQTALKEQNEALTAAAATAKQFLDAHTKLMQARYARDQIVSGISVGTNRSWAPSGPLPIHRTMSDKELAVQLSHALPYSASEREALLILTQALKKQPASGGF